MGRRGFWIKSFYTKMEMRTWIPRVQSVYQKAFKCTNTFYPPTDLEMQPITNTIISVADPSLKESLLAVRKNQPIIFAMVIFLFTWIAMGIIENQLIYFLEYRMGLEEKAPIVSGAVFIAAILFFPFWPYISKKTVKRRSYTLGMIILASVMVTLIFNPPTLGFSIIIILAVIAGIGVSAFHVVTWAMFPDAIDVDE